MKMNDEPAEIEARLRLFEAATKLVHKLAESKKENRPSWYAALNSPFMLTVIGGLALSWASNTWQRNAAEYDRVRTLRAEQHDEKERAMLEFANEFPLAQYQFYEVMKQQMLVRSVAAKATTQPSS